MDEIMNGVIEWFRGGGGKRFRNIIIGVILLVSIIILNPFVTVDAGHRGVVLNFGSVGDTVLNEGLHFRLPIVQRIETMSVQILKTKVDADAATKDLQDTAFSIVVNHHIKHDKVNKIYQTLGLTYESKIISPSIEEACKSITAKYTAEELVTKRQEVSGKIKQLLSSNLAVFDIVIDQFNIVNFSFSESFTKAIEDKQKEEQKGLEAERKLVRIKTEAAQEVAKARAAAESLRLKKAQITPRLLQLEAIKKWDGKLPTVSSGTTPFINLKNF